MTSNVMPLGTPRRRFSRRTMRRVTLATVFVLLLWIVLRLLLADDPAGALLFARAQRLEAAGLAEPARRQYSLLAQTHPTSELAPVALMREAALWLGFARDGETTAFSKAVEVYRRVASAYPGSQHAGHALLKVGEISLNDLNDTDGAKAAYEEALKSYGNNRPVAALATLQLGLVAQRARDGKTAQRWLQQVLARYASETERCAQAQYALGETYETLWRNRDWARNAYETALRLYPKTVWAGKAKERLGMMLYHEAAPRARRVLIQTPAGIGDTTSDTLMDGVRLVLAARGIEAGATTLRGWSLAPFYAGFVPGNPGRAPRIPLTAWETVAANAGLRTRVSDGGDAKGALQTLQSELDAAHLTLIYSGQNGGAWHLAIGYDSARDSVFLQRGAQRENPSSAQLAKTWNRSSPLGGPFGLISFEAPREDSVAQLKAAPISAVPLTAPTPAPAAGSTPSYVKATPQHSALAAPGFLFELKALDEKDGHRRTLRRAAEWLRRTRDENSSGVLLGGEALRTIAAQLRRYANAGKTEAQLPVEELAREEGAAEATATPTPGAEGENSGGEPSNSGGTEPAPPAASTAPELANLRALLAWRETPLLSWINARRDAAAYCDLAAARLNNPSAARAADALRDALAALDDARALLPSPSRLGISLSDGTRRNLMAAAAKLDAARQAEARAADALDEAVR